MSGVRARQLKSSPCPDEAHRVGLFDATCRVGLIGVDPLVHTTHMRLTVVSFVMVSGAVILSGFVAIDFVLDTVTVWGYMAAVGVMIVWRR